MPCLKNLFNDIYIPNSRASILGNNVHHILFLSPNYRTFAPYYVIFS